MRPKGEWELKMTITHADASSTVHGYNRAIVLGMAGVTLLVAWVALYLEYIFIPRRDFLGIAILLFLSYYAVLCFRALLSKACIVLDETGISAKALGMRTKSIRWGNVKKIRKLSLTLGHGYVSSFRIYEARKHNIICNFFLNVCGDIVFNQDIRGLRDLLDQVNFYAREHNIPLVVSDSQSKAARLAPLRGVEYWRGLRTKVPETTVEEF